MRRRAIIPVAEVWIQSDGDLGSEVFSLYRVKGIVHTEVVPREACIKALKHVLERLEKGDHLNIGSLPDEVR